MSLAEALFYDFIALLVIVNPIQAGATFATLTARATPKQQASIAARAAVVATIILIAFGFGGELLLKGIGVGFPAFRIAGGLLLLRVGFNMVFAVAPRAGAERAADEGGLDEDPTVFPLAIPIITGPGALTTMVTLMSKRRESALEVGLVVLIGVAVMALTYVAMRASQPLTKLLGATGVNAIGRVMGIIVAAISIQLIVNGLQEIFPILAR